MVFKSIIGAACACLAVVSFSADAELISVDWKTAGDNLITRDTATGLEWLDLTETTNMSYNYVSSQLNTGGQFDGWQYGTYTQIASLFDSAGGTGPYEGVNTNGIVLPLINLWGETFNNGEKSYSYFLTSIPYDTNDIWYGYIFDSIVPDIIYDTKDYMIIQSGATPTSSAQVRIGSALVRDTVVPIPPAVWLFSSGLIGLIGIARRKANA